MKKILLIILTLVTMQLVTSFASAKTDGGAIAGGGGDAMKFRIIRARFFALEILKKEARSYSSSKLKRWGNSILDVFSKKRKKRKKFYKKLKSLERLIKFNKLFGRPWKHLKKKYYKVLRKVSTEHLRDLVKEIKESPLNLSNEIIKVKDNEGKEVEVTARTLVNQAKAQIDFNIKRCVDINMTDIEATITYIHEAAQHLGLANSMALTDYKLFKDDIGYHLVMKEILRKDSVFKTYSVKAKEEAYKFAHSNFPQVAQKLKKYFTKDPTYQLVYSKCQLHDPLQGDDELTIFAPRFSKNIVNLETSQATILMNKIGKDDLSTLHINFSAKIDVLGHDKERKYYRIVAEKKSFNKFPLMVDAKIEINTKEKRGIKTLTYPDGQKEVTQFVCL